MAEGGSGEDDDEKILSLCDLCYETFEQEELLPCSHSFCLACFDTCVKNNEQAGDIFDCPLCKPLNDLPEGGRRGLQSSDCYRERQTCDLCGPGVNATNNCSICEENYCERCSDVHVKQRATRTHTLVELHVPSAVEGSMTLAKKSHFCDKHPNDELRVVCKDCDDELLCVICKVTEHENHKSRDIAEEANMIREMIANSVKKDENTIYELRETLDNITGAKNEAKIKTEIYTEFIDSFEEKLKQMVNKKTNTMREKIVQDMEQISTRIDIKSVFDIHAIITALESLTIKLNELLCITDDVFVINNFSEIRTMASKQLEQKANFLIRENIPGNSPNYELIIGTEKGHINPRSWNQLVGSYLSFDCNKGVSEIAQVLLYSTVESFRAGSISIYGNACVCSFAYDQCVGVVNSPKDYFNEMWPAVEGQLVCCISVLSDKCFYSVLDTKELKVWNAHDSSHEVMSSFQIYPHGIARRLYKSEFEEILVCVLEDSDMFSTDVCSGMVMAIPTASGREPYNYILKTTPAPTRVAVNKQNGLVCLSYPSVGKISVHFEDGITMYSFDRKHLLPDVGKAQFTPFGICFDNDNCIVLADRDGSQVLRVSVFGELKEVLLEGNKPTTVAVDVNDKLWVGYDDKNVTKYQMTYNCGCNPNIIQGMRIIEIRDETHNVDTNSG